MEVFLENPSKKGQFTTQLTPVCSRPIFSARVMSQLQILDLSDTTSPADGGRKLILVCERVSREDIRIRLSDSSGWEEWAEFTPSDVHKQCAITFRTPPYRHTNISQRVRVSLELVRPSDGATSDQETFFYLPLNHQARSVSSGNDLIDINNELSSSSPVSPFVPPMSSVLTDFNPLFHVDLLDNSGAVDEVLNLSDIMSDLGLKPTTAGLKRSSRDAENDSASLHLLDNICGPNIIANNSSNLSKFLFNCEQINDL